MTIPAAPNRWLLLIVIVLAPLLGWAKVEYQRAHPPEWARKPVHQYEGYVSIDGFARRSAQARDVLRGDDPGAQALIKSLRFELHPSSLSVPFVVGALAIVTGSVPIAFMLVNLFVYALCLWLIARIARRQLEELGLEHARSCAAWAMLVFAAHVDTCRTALQLHVDFTVTCLGLAAVVMALDAIDKTWSARRLGGAVGLNVLGVFTKYSFVPFLAVPAVASLLNGKNAKRWGASAIAILVPMAILALYLSALGSDEPLLHDADMFQQSWRLEDGQLRHFVVELALALQWLPLVLLLPNWRSSRAARLVLSIVGLYLISLLVFGLPAVPRLFLPAVALFSAVSTPLILAVRERGGSWPIYAWVLLNLLLAVLGVRYGN